MTRLKKLISATLALSLLGGSAMAAQTGSRDFGRGGNGSQNNHGPVPGQGGPGRGGDTGHGGFPGRGGNGPGDHDRFGGLAGNRGGNFRPGFGFAPGFDRFHRNFGPSWYVGQRFSPYGLSYFVVNDWYDYHLRRPPIGYHWVRVNGDFLLVGITSGLIADLLLNNYY